MSPIRNIEVCLSPELLHLYDVTGKTVVVADILRATSCMVTAFAHGASVIRPFADLEACRKASAEGYETSAERNGLKVEGFDRGNSPFEYLNGDIRGKKIAFTTTNGTQAIEKAKHADQLFIGAFLNVSEVARRVSEAGRDALIVCAGWKGRFNLEDTLFAGALCHRLRNHFKVEDDAVLAALSLYHEAHQNMFTYLEKSSHVQRLNRINLYEDMAFCLTEDNYQVVPHLQGDHLVL